MGCTLNVLGPLQLLVDGVDVTPQAPKGRSLVALLGLRAGGVVSSDVLIDELWPDLTVERARRVLWVRVAELKAALRRAGAESLLVSARPGYRLDVDAGSIDAERAAALVAQARGLRTGRDDAAAAEALRTALALHRGPPLADAQGCLALEAAARRLGDEHGDAIEAWVDAELACGRHAAVLPELRRRMAEHPFRERLACQLVECLDRSGRRADAVATCREHRDRLRRELGVDATAALESLERDLATRPAAGRHHRPSPHNLPLPETPFVGRRAELADLAALLRQHRLITMTGVGGVGKTRLAVEVARASLERHPGGAWLVELAPLRSDDVVPQAVLATLGVTAGTDVDPAERLAQHIGDRRVLLVLDNAEHVAGGVARLAVHLTRRCARLTVVVTSRAVLHAPGEVVCAVPPMPVPPAAGAATEAVELFRTRAAAARPTDALGLADEHAAGEVCRVLDGIPLAIELAAARVRMLPVAEIAARLDDCLSLLGVGAADDGCDRHRTMRATIDWSHDLLGPPERIALRRLAVFPADFDADAASAVVAGGPDLAAPAGDAFALVTQLVDQSLVEVVGASRRLRLLGPIRQYALERLTEAGEEAAARRAHRDVYLRRDEPMWPLMTSQQRRRAYADRENLVAALEWSWQVGDATAALQLVMVQTTTWMCAGDAEGRRWLERVLAAPEPAAHPARVRALLELAITLHDSGAPRERVDSLLRQAAALAECVDDPLERAAYTLTQVEAAIAQGDIDPAQQLTIVALGVYQEVGATAGEGWCHHYLGWIAVAGDDFERARAEFEESMALARADPGGEWLLPHTMAALAPIAAMQGDREGAVELAAGAVAAARPFEVRAVLAMALCRSAEVRVIVGDDDAAADDLAELLQLLTQLGTRRWLGDALGLVACVLARFGDHEGAAHALGAAEALRSAAGATDGGVRAAAPHVRACATASAAALGPGPWAAARRRGGRSPTAATSRALDALAAAPRVSHP